MSCAAAALCCFLLLLLCRRSGGKGWLLDQTVNTTGYLTGTLRSVCESCARGSDGAAAAVADQMVPEGRERSYKA
jgi:hypothetical protein